jgi:hypothetical protein
MIAERRNNMSEFTDFLREIARSIGGDECVEQLDELADICTEVEKKMRMNALIPQDKIDRYNELVKKLYPEKYGEKKTAAKPDETPERDVKISKDSILGLAKLLDGCGEIDSCVVCPNGDSETCKAELNKDAAFALRKLAELAKIE